MWSLYPNKYVCNFLSRLSCFELMEPHTKNILKMIWIIISHYDKIHELTSCLSHTKLINLYSWFILVLHACNMSCILKLYICFWFIQFWTTEVMETTHERDCVKILYETTSTSIKKVSSQTSTNIALLKKMNMNFCKLFLQGK
jgi:hypothetical protein